MTAGIWSVDSQEVITEWWKHSTIIDKNIKKKPKTYWAEWIFQIEKTKEKNTC